MNHKALYITFNAPPSYTGSAIVALRLAQNFDKNQLIVAGFLGNDSDKSHLENIVYIGRRFRAVRFASLLMYLLTPVYCYRIIKIILKEKVDILITSYPTQYMMFLTYLSKILTGKKFIIYFHNSMSPFAIANKSVFDKDKIMEKFYINKAIKIFTISEALTNYYKLKYPDKSIITLPHIVSDYVYPSGVSAPTEDFFIFSGSINASNNIPTKILFQAVYEITQRKIVLVSSTPKSQLEHFEILQFVDLRKNVSDNDLFELLNQAKFILFSHGWSNKLNQTENQTIFPTKTLDYLKTETPILALLPKKTYIFEFINKIDNILVFSKLDIGNLKNELNIIFANFQFNPKSNRKQVLQNFSPEYISKIWNKHIR